MLTPREYKALLKERNQGGNGEMRSIAPRLIIEH